MRNTLSPKWPVLLLCTIASLAIAETRAWVRRDIPANGSINLKEYGGTDISITITGREMSAIFVRWTDNTRKVPKKITDASGVTSTVWVSPSYNRAIKKERGVSVDGGLSEAFLIFSDPETGLNVYFYDTIAAQNQYALLIEPAATVPSTNVTARPEPLPPVGELIADGPGSPLMRKEPDPADPSTPPTWTAIGESLFYRGNEITDRLSNEARAFGISRDTFVEERAWIEKQRTYGRDQEAEYHALAQQRLMERPQSERRAIESMRARFLSPAGNR